MVTARSVEAAYILAAECYAQWGVDVEQALATLSTISISLHCWQGDDVGGFENNGTELGSGLAVTGNYPGRARNVSELRSDLEFAYSLIPGTHRLNLHAMYGEFENPVDRDEIDVEHFRGWIDWAKSLNLGVDFNPTFFAHPLAADGFTLSHQDAAIRQFWIRHGLACRKIAAAFGSGLGRACINNTWIPDGYKDTPANRTAPRERLMSSLDELFSVGYEPRIMKDAVEAKLFGIGSESYVVGSHEFYMGYAVSRQKLLCLDAGHFHPTESIADKISSTLLYVPELLLHVSRGVRWDSDHVVTLNDDTQSIMHEIVRTGAIGRVHIGLDFFDASINRVAAWTIGTRNTLKALLIALLEPTATLQQFEKTGDLTSRLAWIEEQKSLPWQAIWDYHCLKSNVPVGRDWLAKVREYEVANMSHRQISTISV